MVELLKQPPYAPIAVEKQILIIFAGAKGYLDSIDVKSVGRFESELKSFVEARYPEIIEQLQAKKAIDKELEELLHKALSEFKATFAVK